MNFPPQSTPASRAAPGSHSNVDRSCRVLIRDYPHRAIAIASNSHALIFRHSPTTSEAIANGSLVSVSSTRSKAGDGNASKCMVEFSSAADVLDDYRSLTPRPIFGTLGLISINRDVFLCVITQASRVATLRPGETIEKILAVEFFCLNTSDYDDVLSSNPWDIEPDGSSIYGQGPSRKDGEAEHPCQDLQKMLGNGSFYYSTDFDLTNRLQDRPADASTFDIDNFDEGFLWNSFMVSPLVQFRSRLQTSDRQALDGSRILTSAIRGFCLTLAIPQASAPLRVAASGMPSYLTVISRLSCRRAGTRFNSRGIDDDGNVANFVETETIYWSPSGVVFSYSQVRGSVPVFFEQAAGLVPGQQKITITRSHDAAQPALDKHFEDLEQAYGAVHIINLLSETKPGEAELTRQYRFGVQHCPLTQRGGSKTSQDHALLRSTEYDFHAETKGPSGYEAAQQIRRYIEDSADGFAYYLAEETDDVPLSGDNTGHRPRRFVVVLQQEGVFRTNCLDCLDRTNLIQTIISQMALEAFLNHRGEHPSSDFLMRHSSLWADNGDSLSRIYAGTGALKSSFTRHGKMSLAGAIADVRKSAARLYINNFADKGRQNTIDLLLGRLYGQMPVVLFDPISDYVNSELNRRAAEFSTTETINMWVGTFNLNGRTDGIEEDLSPWLCPDVLGSSQPEIVAVGFQEIVELSPQQIMNSDPRRKKLWESAVSRTLNARAKGLGGENYVLLRSGQLVGAALCIFVKASALKNIKNVEGSVKKTGMSGIAGNKGAVAIRLDYASTPICFVTAHLAAGFANYEERNKDYTTIHHGLRFQRDRSIDNHDTVIWLGDFNYRIGLSREKAIGYVRQGDLERLYENDQLNLQMVAGLSFPFYSEARITFFPTYKFDLGKDEYDSSEKQRIPAWTDRILRKGANIRQNSYNSAPLRFSDHRPVYATFTCIVNLVDEVVRDSISRNIYEKRKLEVGDSTANIGTEDTDDEELIGYDAVEPGLPPASSDRQKWWLENGKMARSTVQPPRLPTASHAAKLNPNRPSNPFALTDEPDWVTVPRHQSRKPSVSELSLSTSPYEQINFSTFLPTTSIERKPAPHHQSQKTADLAMKDNSRSRSEAPPPAPPPRRQQSFGTGAKDAAARSSLPVSRGMAPVVAHEHPSIVRKEVPLPPPSGQGTGSPEMTRTATSRAAPPVARKPAHLTSGSPSDSPKSPSGLSQNGASRNGETRTPSKQAQKLRSSIEENTDPPSPRRSTTDMVARKAPAQGVKLPGFSSASGKGPQLPVRKPTIPPLSSQPRTMAKTQQFDLLDDDNGRHINGWETLKPS